MLFRARRKDREEGAGGKGGRYSHSSRASKIANFAGESELRRYRKMTLNDARSYIICPPPLPLI